VSFRQKFSSTIKDKFPNFESYVDVKGKLVQPKIIVQVESLHRLETNDMYIPDLLILDEVEAILEQFNSGLLKSFSNCFSKFKWLLKNSKHIICMDANLSNRTYNIMDAIIPNRLSNAVFHNNIYKNATKDNYLITHNAGMWNTKLFDDLKNNQKIVICASSLKMAKTLHELIKQKFNTLSIKIYSSETNASELKYDFSDVATAWENVDVLIYTPTLSAGISFEKQHFDKLYGYFISTSCSVETCIQMMGRIRNIGTKEYNLYLCSIKNDQPEETNLIIDYFIKNKEILYNDYDSENLGFDIDDNGRVIFYDPIYLKLWSENMKIKNLSRNNFTKRFVQILREYGCSINKLVYHVDDIVEEIDKTKQKIKEKENKDIAEAKELNDEQLSVIREKKDNNEQLTMDEKLSFTKYKIHSSYDTDYKKISPDFVEKYGNYNSMLSYKNLCLVISNDGCLKTTLNSIKSYEKPVFNPIKNQYTQLSNYNKHLSLFTILQLLGFAKFYGEKVDFDKAHSAISQNVDKYCNCIETLCFELAVKKPSFVKIRKSMKLIENVVKQTNTHLSALYDSLLVIDDNTVIIRITDKYNMPNEENPDKPSFKLKIKNDFVSEI
jgi:hypothetical protein